MSRFPNAPARIRALPVDHRGFPIPWFVAVIDDAGTRDFRVADPRKKVRAIRQKLCWVCGGELGRAHIYVIGPMCAVNRTTSEPPCHLDCARFAAEHCPFLANPRMRRNEHRMPDHVNPGGTMIERNPGAVCLWRTRRFEIFSAGDGQLIELGDPEAVEWWAEGRRATRDQVLASIDSGFPLLEAECEKDPRPEEARAELARYRARAMKLLPAEAA